jgi:hypothetical protein
MAIDDIPLVNPGDLITADFCNELIGTLIALDARVTKLEKGTVVTPGGAPVIEHRNPSGIVRVGDLLTLTGRNFSPLSRTRVRIGTAPAITAFTGDSTDTRLTFGVPDAFASLPVSTTLVVETPLGTSSPPIGITIERALQQNPGRVLVTEDISGLAKIEVGKTYQLQWLVTSETLLPDTYAFSIDLDNGDPAGSESEWDGLIKLNVLEKQIVPTTPLLVTATVKIPDVKSARLKLNADSAERHGESGPITLKVGEKPPESAPGMKFIRVAQPPNDANSDPNVVTEANGTVLFPAGATAWVFTEIQFADLLVELPASYRFFAELGSPTTGWRVTGDNRPATVIRNQHGGSVNVWYGLENTATTAAPHPTELIVKAAKRKDGADEYVSFQPISIDNAG